MMSTMWTVRMAARTDAGSTAASQRVRRVDGAGGMLAAMGLDLVSEPFRVVGPGHLRHGPGRWR